MRKISMVVLAAVIASMVVAPAASAGTRKARSRRVAPRQVSTLNVLFDGPIVWVEADVPSIDTQYVTVRVFTPPDPTTGSRTLYQRCQYAYTGPGNYRCGMMVDSLTAGQWLGRVSVDGIRIAQSLFVI